MQSESSDRVNVGAVSKSGQVRMVITQAAWAGAQAGAQVHELSSLGQKRQTTKHCCANNHCGNCHIRCMVLPCWDGHGR